LFESLLPTRICWRIVTILGLKKAYAVRVSIIAEIYTSPAVKRISKLCSIALVVSLGFRNSIFDA
jgi:hypothetical protein